MQSVRNKLRERSLCKQSLLMLLVLCLSTSACFLAGQASADNSVRLNVGEQIPYAGYSTGRMSTDDGSPVICAQPTKSTPSAGLYQKKPLMQDMKNPGDYTEWRNRQVRSALYYGWGSPGFRADVWPGAWYDGSAMDGDRYLALEHILISDFYALDAAHSLAGTYPEFQTWCKRWVIGVDDAGEHPDATRFKLTDLPEPPESFHCFSLAGDGGAQTCVSFDALGSLKLKKASSAEQLSRNNACYSLAGAVYGMYSDPQCASKIGELITNENGEAFASNIAPGMVYVKELTPAPGFTLDQTVYATSVASGRTATVNGTTVTDEPLGQDLELLIAKHDSQLPYSESQNNKPIGNRNLAGAKFQVTHYAGYFNDEASAEQSGTKTRQWILGSDLEGKVLLRDSYLKGGNALYRNKAGKEVLPLGTVAIKETEAPEGYLTNDAVWVQQIKPDGSSGRLGAIAHTTVVPEMGMSGGVSLVKTDAETGESQPQGAGSLDAQFQIVNNSVNEVLVGGKLYGAGEVVYTGKAERTPRGYLFTTDADGDGVDHTLPYGTYEIRESQPPQGYLQNDEPIPFAIQEDGEVVALAERFNDPVKRGGLAFLKHDSELNRPNPQGDGELDAWFEIVSNNDASVMVAGKRYAKDDVVYRGKAKADPQGDYRFETPQTLLPYGSYTLRESTAASGYLPCSEEYHFEITDHERYVTINSGHYDDDVKRGGMRMVKTDAETHRSTPQGDASLEAHFEIVNESPAPVVVEGREHAPGAVCWRGTSKRTDVGYVLTTDSDGDGVDRTLPFGTYSIRESEPSTGCLPSTKTVRFEVRTDGEVISIEPSRAIENAPIRGGVEFSKLDLESKIARPLGSATLDATFEIVNKSANDVLVDGVLHSSGDVVCTLTAKKDEKDEWSVRTASDKLPYGTYLVREATPGVGYNTDDKEITFEIREQGKMVKLATLDQDGGAATFANQVKRGDLEFKKVREADMARLSGVPFKVVSQTTGETHVLVTDDNGFASTSAAWNKHSHNTNANDSFLNGNLNGSPDGTDNQETPTPPLHADAEAGIWFGLAGDGSMVAPDDQLGALPYDRYTIEEMRCAQNEGLQLVRIEDVSVSRDAVTIDLGTIDDETDDRDGDPSLQTQAWDATDLDKTLAVGAGASVVDLVEYSGLQPGQTYVLKAQLHDVESREPIVGSTAHVTFAPKTSSGSCRMEIPFDARSHGGRRIVAFETLTLNGNVVAEHVDFNDPRQTVIVAQPTIESSATSDNDDTKTLFAASGRRLVDTIDYHGLRPGETYRLEGTILLREDDLEPADGMPETGPKEDPTPSSSAQGHQTALDSISKGTILASSSIEFVAEGEDGTVEVPFQMDASGIAGRFVVCAQSLHQGDVLIAEHVDLNASSQTLGVTRPSITTSAHDAVDGDGSLAPSSHCTLEDVVSFEGLVSGQTYTLEGFVHALDDEGNVSEDPLAQAEVEFVAEGSTGSTTVPLHFDTRTLPDKTRAVVFERLLCEGHVVARHEDPTDRNQMVSFALPELRTLAKGDLTEGVEGSKGTVSLTHDATVHDTVSYIGVAPGVEHEMRGSLMLVPDGEEPREVAATSNRFTPDATSGTIEISFTLDTRNLPDGAKLVAYETLLAGDVPIAEHADPKDPDQTVLIKRPSLKTHAHCDEGRDKDLLASRHSTIIDRVSFDGLKPGVAYELQTSVRHVEGQNAEARKADGTPATTTTRFTPQEEQGWIDVSVEVDSSRLMDGQRLVVYERLMQDGAIIASHEDAEDESQQVVVPSRTVATKASDGVDGDGLILPQRNASIIDEVEFTGLPATGKLQMWTVVADRSTGLPLIDGSAAGSSNTQRSVSTWKKVLGALGLRQDAEGKLQKADAANAKELERALNLPEGDQRLIATVTPIEAKNGKASAQARLDFDASQLRDGTELTVFQFVMHEEDEVWETIAWEVDTKCEEQSIRVAVPRLGSELTNAQNNSHTLKRGTQSVLTDRVTYTGLQAGENREYVLSGTLVDKETGKAIVAEGGPVTAQATFKPKEQSGSVELEYRFDSVGLESTEIVSMTSCAVLGEDGPETVARHEDVNDEMQKIDLHVPSTPSKELLDKTGAVAWGLMAGGVLLAAGAVLVFLGRRKLYAKPTGRTQRRTTRRRDDRQGPSRYAQMLGRGTGAGRSERTEGAGRSGRTASARRRPNTGRSRKRLTCLAFGIVAILLACIALALHQAMWSSANPSAHSPLAETVEASDQPASSLSIDWDHWNEVNPDVIAWVKVDATPIDHPILVPPSDDPDFYLTHDAYKRPNVFGAPYLDRQCHSDFSSPNTIIYGHHMSDGSMFSAFARFSDEDFAKTHMRIALATPQGDRTLYVKLVDVVDAESFEKQAFFSDANQFAQWYLDAAEESEVVLDPNAPRSPIVTFCTCSYGQFDNQRTLVMTSDGTSSLPFLARLDE